jgi:hypothetical protein
MSLGFANEFRGVDDVEDTSSFLFLSLWWQGVRTDSATRNPVYAL